MIQSKLQISDDVKRKIEGVNRNKIMNMNQNSQSSVDTVPAMFSNDESLKNENFKAKPAKKVQFSSTEIVDVTNRQKFLSSQLSNESPNSEPKIVQQEFKISSEEQRMIEDLQLENILSLNQNPQSSSDRVTKLPTVSNFEYQKRQKSSQKSAQDILHGRSAGKSSPEDPKIPLNTLSFKDTATESSAEDSSKKLNAHVNNNQTPKRSNSQSQSPTIKVSMEIVDTELSYISSMRRGMDDFIYKFDSSNLPNSLKGQRQKIFSNIEEIHEIHLSEILPKLLPFRLDPLRVSEAFIRFMDQNLFDCYITYSKERKISSKLCVENGFFFNQIQTDQQGVERFHQLPLERVWRYKILLETIADDVAEDPDQNETAKAKCREASDRFGRFYDSLGKASNE